MSVQQFPILTEQMRSIGHSHDMDLYCDTVKSFIQEHFHAELVCVCTDLS